MFPLFISSLISSIFNRGPQGYNIPVFKRTPLQKSSYLSMMFGEDPSDYIKGNGKGKKNSLRNIYNRMVSAGKTPYGQQLDLRDAGNSAVQQVLGDYTGSSEGGDLNYYRGITDADRELRNNYLQQSQNYTPNQSIIDMANSISGENVQRGLQDLYSGDMANALKQTFNQALGSVHQRGLSGGSSAGAQAASDAARRQLRGAENIISQGNQQRSQLIYDAINQANQNALGGAGILNQGFSTASQILPALMNAGVNIGGLGLQSQDLGFNQQAAITKTLNQDRLNQNRKRAAQAGAAAGQQVSF